MAVFLSSHFCLQTKLFIVYMCVGVCVGMCRYAYVCVCVCACMCVRVKVCDSFSMRDDKCVVLTVCIDISVFIKSLFIAQHNPPDALLHLSLGLCISV